MCMYGSSYRNTYSHEQLWPKKEMQARKIAQKTALECIKNEVDDVPADFYKWAHSKLDKIMFFEKNKKNDYTGYCACGEKVTLRKASPGKYITCPECGETVRLRSVKHPYYGGDWEAYALLSSTSKGWMQRLFIIYKDTRFENDTKTVSESYYKYEEERSHVSYSGQYHEFHSAQTDGRWLPGPGRIHGQGWSGWRLQDKRMHTYPNNIQALFADSRYKYSQLITVTEHSKINPLFYLMAYDKYPKQLEMIYKNGLYKLGEEICGYTSFWNGINADSVAKSSLKDLSIENQADLTECAKFNLGYKELIARKHIKGWQINEEERRTAIEFARVFIRDAGEDFKYSFISAESLFKYYLTQQKQCKDISDFSRDYRDYISDAIFLKMDVNDTKVKTPKDFKYCKDVVTARAHEKRERQEKQRKARKARSLKALLAKQSKQFTYADKKYAIVVPLCEEDLKNEGKNNNNCVYGYCDRILDGRSIVVFLRKAQTPTETFCTVELQPESFKVIQCRAKSNSAPPTDAIKWVEKYTDRLRNTA